MSMKRYLILSLVLWTFVGCTGDATSRPADIPEYADTLIYYSWVGDNVVSIFDDFAAEYGVEVIYTTYESQEEAIENIRSGAVYDVVVLENQYVPEMIADGLLAEIDYRNVPNFKNVSANFRDLAYDPNNAHTIPYSWGTTGLLVRTDLVEDPVTSWADMWNPHYAGKVIGWRLPRYTIGSALLSLGYSVNSEDRAELEEALARLIELDKNAVLLDGEVETVAPFLVDGDAVMALGWVYDYWLAQEENVEIEYVLPKEGAILWGDNLAIPANSAKRETSELFLNFVLRPEISAQMINANYYPMPNDAATPFIDPEILNDPTIYPSNQDMQNAELLLPVSDEGKKLYDEIWQRFLAATN